MLLRGVDCCASPAAGALEAALQEVFAGGFDFTLLPLLPGAVEGKDPFFSPTDDEAVVSLCVEGDTTTCATFKMLNIPPPASSGWGCRHAHLVANSRSWARAVCGVCAAPGGWGDGEGLRTCLAKAQYFGMPCVVLPPLPQEACQLSKAAATAAALLAELAANSVEGGMKLWIEVGASAGHWRQFDHFCRLCGLRQRNQTAPSAIVPYICLEAAAGKAEGSCCLSWLGEDVAAVNVSCVTDKPFLASLMARRVPVVFGLVAHRDALLSEVHLLDRLRHEVPNERRDTFAQYEDVLEIPLQPLGTHLPNSTYNVFEDDKPKYDAYYEAIKNHLARLNTRREIWKKAGTLHVVVLGAGRGPLVTACLNASIEVGCSDALRVTAVEKNPNAGLFLQLKAKSDPLWQSFGGRLAVVCCNGRDVDVEVKEGCDFVVSELLGSFGDNELSPECLHGFLGQTRVVSCPESYTSILAPICSSKLYEAVCCPPPSAAAKGDLRFHASYVTHATKYLQLAPAQSCLEFSHREPAQGESDFTKETELRFESQHEAYVDGLLGTFSATLESAVELCTEPTRHTPKDMYSWFPLFFPLPERLKVAPGDSIVVTLRRCHSERRGAVWYEWSCSTAHGSSPLMNPNGAFSSITF